MNNLRNSYDTFRAYYNRLEENTNEPLLSLRETLLGLGYTVPEYDVFKRDMQDENNLRGVYSTLQREGYAPPAFDDFKRDMGYVAPSQPVVQSEAQPQERGVWQPSWHQQKGMQMQLDDMNKRMEQSQQDFATRMENIRKGNTFGKTSERKYNPETGTFEQRYYTTTGEEVGSGWEQSRLNLAERDRWESTTDEGRRHRERRMENDFERRVGSSLDKYDPENAAAAVWQQAEERSKEEFGRYLSERSQSSWRNLARDAADGMSVTGGLGGDNVDTGIQGFATHLKHHDLRRMADDAWNMLGKEKQQSVIEDMYGALKNRYPQATEEQLQQAASEMAREQSDRRIYELAVSNNAPHDAAEYFLRKVAAGNAMGTLMQAAARAQAGTTGDWAAREDAERRFEKQGHKVAGIAGAVTGFALDPLVWVTAGGGGAAVKGTTWLGGEMIGEAAMRKFGTTLGGRMLGGVIGGAANLGAYEAGSEVLDQMKWGGYIDEETGERKDGFSFGNVAGRAGHGLMMGTATGVIAPYLGNVSDKLVRATESTVGKMGIRLGELGVGTVAEGTIFSVPQVIDTYGRYGDLINSLSDETSPNYIADEQERAAKIEELRNRRGDALMDVWTDNMAMMAGFKGQHLLKSAPRVIGELAASKNGKAGFETRLRSILDGRDDLALTEDEKKELDSRGYGDLKELTEEYSRYAEAKEEYDKARPTTTDASRMIEGGDGQAELPYNRFVDLMTDNSVSEAARAKMYYYLTGRTLPMSTVMGSRVFEDKDGEGNVTGYTVQSLGANGVITSRSFGDKKRADVEVNRIDRQAELNGFDVGERYFDWRGDNKRMYEACEAVAEETGAPANLLFDLMKRKTEAMNEVEREWAEKILNAYNGLGDKYGSSEVRAAINEEFGIDVDKAIRKERNRRSEQEQKAVEEYANRLFADVKRKQEEASERGEAPINPDAPTTDSQIAGLLGIDDGVQGDPASAAFTRGYEADAQERQDIAIELADPNNAEAQEAWNGVVQRINEDAAYMVAQQREQTKRMQHTDGSLRPAILKEKDSEGHDQPVYIVDGNVQMMPDGSMVDKASSDNIVVVHNPATGERKQIDPTADTGISSLGEVTSAEQREADIERSRQEYVQAQIDEAQGTVRFVPGQQLVLPTGEEAIVVATDADGEDVTVALGDGTQTTVQRSALQRIRDEKALAGYRQRHGIGEEPAAQQPEASTPAQPQADVRVAGAPAYYTADMELTIRDEDGTEKSAIVMGMFRMTPTGPVFDPNGKIVGYLMDGEPHFKHETKLAADVVSHIVPQQVEAAAVQGVSAETPASVELSPQPVGKGVFGNIYDQFKGKAKAAIDFLLSRKEGNAVGALHHKDVGDIDLWYGDDNAGLKKIAKKHPEVLEDLQGIIEKMRVVYASENRVILESDTHRAVVSKDWYGKKADNWLLTAYEKKGTSGGSIDIVPEPETGRQNGTAPLQDSLSDGKVGENPAPVQGNGGKVALASQQTVQAAEAPVQASAQPMLQGEPELKSEARKSYESAVEKYGEKASAKIGITVKDREKAVEKAKKALDKAQAAYDEAPIGKEEKAEKALDKAQAVYDEAQAELEHWKAVREIQSGIQREENARRAAADAVRYDEAVAEAQAAYEARKSAEAERKAVGNENPMPAITEKWNNATKVDGHRDEIVLPNGESVKGHYVLHESGASSPSHDPVTWQKTDGFPMDANDNSVNDRDYERDRDAQEHTQRIARQYDQRALQSVPVVSNDGVVLSGNGRTMAGELAARDNTDGAYVNYLKEYAPKFGFTAEQVGAMEHPRVSFVPDEAMPYTAETFAKFNQQEMKSQNKTEQAVKLGKTVSDNSFKSIIRTINGYDTLGDFYNDAQASLGAVYDLHNAGVVPQAQLAEMVDGVRGQEKLSAIGREFLENMLIGKAFEGDPEVVRMLTAEPAMRQTVITALGEIVDNIALGKGWSLQGELADAVKLCFDARQGGAKHGEIVSTYARQGVLFADPDELQTVADFNNATMLMLADVLNDKRVTLLKITLQLYNNEARQSATGEQDLFAGGVKSREDILRKVINFINENYGKRKEIEAARAAAVERRKAESVQQDGTPPAVGGGSEDAGGGERSTTQDELRKTDLVGIRFTLNEKTAGNGERFYQNEDGDIDLVDIPQEVFDAIDYPKAPLRLTPSMISHMIGQHGKETGAKDVDKAIEFILDVMNNFDHVRLGRGGALIFSVENGRAKTGKRAISILLSSKTGDFYGIVSSGYEGVERLSKRPQLWAGSAIITPASDSATEPVTTLDARQGGGQLGSASGQNGLSEEWSASEEQNEQSATDNTLRAADKSDNPTTPNGNVSNSSAGKGSENSATLQEKGEKSAENQISSAVEDAFNAYKERVERQQAAYERRSMLTTVGDPRIDAERERLEAEREKLVKEAYAAEKKLRDALSVFTDEELRSMADKAYDEGDMFRSNASRDVLSFRQRVRITAAEADTNTEPTEAQKEAGNYKKGHVKIDGYDVTIENPKGSVRRGTDASGKQWEQEMQNTYGYIRGTEGVDGDHIDVFFSEDPSQGDVFVVDQVNKDGSFDEHKVMYGFPDIESARKAYLSNYEDGWQGLGAITPVSKEEFKKWTRSSHRKTKPFAEYRSVKTLGDTQLGEQPNKPTVKEGEDYVDAAVRIAKEKEVKQTAAHFPMETPEEAAAFDKRVPEMSDEELLAYMQEDGKGDVNEAHHPSVYDEYDSRHNDEYGIYMRQADDAIERIFEGADKGTGPVASRAETDAIQEIADMLSDAERRWSDGGSTSDERTALMAEMDVFSEWLDRNIRSQKVSDGIEALTEQDAAMRDAVVGLMRDAGIEVSTDWEEGQRVLDADRERRAKLMGSRVEKRKARIASELKGRELTANQQAVVDVFTGANDNQPLVFTDKDGKERRVIMRQGNEQRAGTKHSIFGHYGTTEGVITADDILLVPDVLSKGERKAVKRGKTPLYKYALKDENGTEYTVLTEVDSRREAFADFYTNKKTSQSARKTHSEEARDIDNGDVSGAKLQKVSESANNSPVFYSNAERAVDGIRQEKATAEQWLAMIRKAGGLKAGEDKWLGLSEWLDRNIRSQKVSDGIEALTEQDAAMRDAVVGLMRDAGIEVSTDWEEGQRVLDMANGRATLNRGQKKLLDTAPLIRKEGSPADISSSDGAKVIKNLDTLASELENISSWRKNILSEIADALGAEAYGSNSKYATFTTKNGQTVTIRLGNHNASTASFDNNSETNGISIVISRRANSGVNNNGNAHLVEFFYSEIALRKADGKPLAEIVRSIQQALYSGEYKDTTGLAEREEVNIGGLQMQKVSPVFYSNAAKAVEGIRQEKATAEQWLAMIQKAGGLKAGEDKWLGLSEWLTQRKTAGYGGSVTKQEVLDFIRANQIQIEEVEYVEYDDQSEFDGYRREFKGYYDEALSEGSEDPQETAWHRMVDEYGDDFELGFYAIGDELRWDNDSDYVEWELENSGSNNGESRINDTRLRYTTDGLENKREIALVVPTVESWNESDKLHFGDAGGGRAVAWVRFGETSDADGKRVLVIDEIQSKRHQEGRENGYRDPVLEKKMKRMDELTDKMSSTDGISNEEYAELQQLRAEGVGRASMGMSGMIPDAPFEKNWHELAMKRMLRYAAENGYDKVAWTTGAQQAERYNIGGEGMKGFYDQMLPRFMDKYGKKWGVKTGDVVLSGLGDNGMTMHSVDITSEMRASVMAGQPMFFKTGHDEAFAKEYEEARNIVDKPARIEKLRKSKPVVATGDEYKGKYELDNKSAATYINNELRGSYRNEDTGEQIKITRKGAFKVTHHDAENEVHLKSVALIPEMIKKAVFITEQTNDKQVSGFDTYKYYVVGMKIGGVDYTAKLVIGVKNGETYYDHALTEIEKTDLINRRDEISSSFTDNEGSEFGYKDKRLFSILQVNPEEIALAEQKMREIEELRRGNNFFRTHDGEAYGFTLNGKIYIDPRIATSETPVHEYHHLWSDALEAANPEAWSHLKEQLLEDEDLAAFVKGLYPELAEDENTLAHEMFSQFGGRRGSERLRQEEARMERENKDGLVGLARIKAMFARLRNLLSKYWQMARELFAGNNARLKDMSVEDFADMAMADLLNKVNPGEDAAKRADNPHKARQYDIVTRANRMEDSYHTGIRSIDDIKTFAEAVNEGEGLESYPDFTASDAKKALEKGSITVYSSKPIENGVFVSASRREAEDYAGGGKVYSKEVPLGDVAWIYASEGQYAKVAPRKEAHRNVVRGRDDIMFQKVPAAKEGRLLDDEEKAQAREKLESTTPIAASVGMIKTTDHMTARQAAEQWAKENIPEPLHYQTDAGDVIIDQTSVKNSLAHGYNQAKLDAIPTLRDGFKGATYIGSMDEIDGSDRNKTVNHYFAYPIDYEGGLKYVFCRAKADANKNRLYVHEVFVADKLESNALQTAAGKSSEPHRGIALYRNILSDVLNAKVGNNSDIGKENGGNVTEDTAKYRIREDELEQLLSDGSLSLEERTVLFTLRMSERHKDDMKMRNDAMRAIGGNLSDLRKAMSLQRTFDMTTVKRVADLARVLIAGGYLDDMSKGEVKRLLSAVKNSVGHNDIEGDVQKVMDIMVDNQLKRGKRALDDLLKIKGSKVDARGVEVQGELDPAGQAMMEAFKDGRRLTREALEEEIGKELDRMSSESGSVRERAENAYAGLQFAMLYAERIADSKYEEKVLRDELKQKYDETSERDRATDSYRQYVKATEDAIRQNKIERAQSYFGLVSSMTDSLRESIANAQTFKKAEKQRVQDIHHLANSDMQGRELRGHRGDSRLDRLNESWLVRFGLSPLSSFDQFMRLFGAKNADGKGYLFNHFMRKVIDSSDHEQLMKEKYEGMLEEKVKELFGTHRVVWNGGMKKVPYTYTALYGYVDALPMSKVRYYDGAAMREYDLSQAQLGYLYAVDKMLMGMTTNRRMGVTDEVMEQIEGLLDPKLKAFLDWLQEDFLVVLGNECNEVYKRMFGANMADIEHYFPFVRDKNAIKKEVENGEGESLVGRISTKTGALIKRTPSVAPWDLPNANILDVVANHVSAMCQWSSYAELNRDLGTLLSYNRFKQQVLGMRTIYGSGEGLWKRFMQSCAIVGNAYEPKRGEADKLMVLGAKGVTMGKIAFRPMTAMKQLLSLPAFFGEVDMETLAKDFATGGIPSVKWAWENMPNFRKRIKSRTAGDFRLSATEYDKEKGWTNRLMQIASYGMMPNIGVDAWTIALGSHAVYVKAKNKYLRWGYSEERAERWAVQDAEWCFNKSQQSCEGAFMAPVQMDHTFASTAMMLFRNSSTSYTREHVTSVRNLKRMMTGEVSVDFMAKQILRNAEIPTYSMRFDEELQHQVDGTLSVGHIYSLGMPGGILQSAGFPDAPIELSATRLSEKASQAEHPFPIEALKGLVDAMNRPIAVFKYGNNAMNVIVGLEYKGKQFLVGVHFNQHRGGTEVSSVRGLFPKDNAEWLNWISQGKSAYLDHQKIKALIAQQRINLADVAYLDLKDVAKVMKNFVNPDIPEQKYFAGWREEDVRHAREQARKDYRGAYIRNSVNAVMFGYILPWLWRIGGSVTLLTLGGDNDEKEREFEKASKQSLFGPLEGLAYGDVLADALYVSGNKLFGDGSEKFSHLGRTSPFISDLSTVFSKLDGDKMSAINDVLNMLVGMNTGVNLQTISDWVTAILDYSPDGETSREVSLLVARLLNAPQSQIDKIYFDEIGMSGEEASRLSPKELVERYAAYKVKRDHFVTPWVWGDEALLDKKRETGGRIVKERTEQMGDERVNEAYERYTTTYKEIDARIKDMRQSAKEAVGDDERAMLYEDLGHYMSGDAGSFYNTYRSLDSGLNSIVKKYLEAKTPDEAALCRRAVLEYKSAMVRVLDARGSLTSNDAMYSLGEVMQNFLQEYEQIQQRNR